MLYINQTKDIFSYILLILSGPAYWNVTITKVADIKNLWETDVFNYYGLLKSYTIFDNY